MVGRLTMLSCSLVTVAQVSVMIPGLGEHVKLKQWKLPYHQCSFPLFRLGQEEISAFFNLGRLRL